MLIFIKMKKALIQKIEIPEGVEANIDGNQIIIKGTQGELIRKFVLGRLNLKKDKSEIIIKCEKATKREKKTMNTIASHIKNMINGVQKEFEYQLKVCFNHFPMTIEIKNNEAIIKNFLGEKVPRKVKILDKTEVKIDKDVITVTSIDKELAGQTAANFEKATKIRMKDRRVFQDGIFLISKAGKEI